MDPNENLREIREITKELDSGSYLSSREVELKADRLVSLVMGLDEWLSKGGFLPKEWER
jgi:hypothetical protein